MVQFGLVEPEPNQSLFSSEGGCTLPFITLPKSQKLKTNLTLSSLNRLIFLPSVNFTKTSKENSKTLSNSISISMARLPPDLITDILSRLPVKTLLQFRSVSKPWCSIIDSPRFITLHLNKSLHTKSDFSLIIQSADPLLSLDFDPLQNLTRIPHPFLPSFAAVLSSCNGLLLLQGLDMSITLFNPSTRKHFNILSCDFDRLFSAPGSDRHLDIYFVYGLGFDPVADDYKVIRLIESNDDDKNLVWSESRIYSLKTNSWKKIKVFPYSLPSSQLWGVSLEGGFHTVVKKYRDREWPKLLVSIDFATEDYKTLPLPAIPDENLVKLSLGRLGNCLCLDVRFETSHQEFWVMKEYGVGESWTKLLSTPAATGIDVPMDPMKILAYSKCGKKILFSYDNREFVWFDLKTRAFAKIPFPGLPELFNCDACVNSLVRPDSYGKNANNVEKERKMKEKKTRNQRDNFLSIGFKLKL